MQEATTSRGGLSHAKSFLDVRQYFTTSEETFDNLEKEEKEKAEEGVAEGSVFADPWENPRLRPFLDPRKKPKEQPTDKDSINKIQELATETIKAMDSTRLASLLEQNARHLSKKQLKAIDVNNVPLMHRVYILCSRTIFPRLPSKMKEELNFELTVHKVQKNLKSKNDTQVATIPFEIIDAIDLETLRNLGTEKVVSLLNSRWNQFNNDKIQFFLRNLPAYALKNLHPKVLRCLNQNPKISQHLDPRKLSQTDDLERGASKAQELKEKTIRNMHSSQLAEMLETLAPFLSKSQFNAIDVEQVPLLHRVYILCSDDIFPELPEKMRESLEFERSVHEIIKTLPEKKSEEIARLPFEVIQAIDVQTLEEHGENTVIQLLNKYSKELMGLRLDYFMYGLPYSHWNFLHPSVIYHFGKKRKNELRHNNFSTEAIAFREACQTLNARKEIREKLKSYLTMTKDLVENEKSSLLLDFLKIFIFRKKTENEGEITVSMVPRYVREAHAMYLNKKQGNFSLPREITRFKNLAELFCEKIEDEKLSSISLGKPLYEIFPTQENRVYALRSQKHYIYQERGFGNPLGISTVLGSLYPIYESGRVGDPIADDIQYLAYPKCFIFSIADGCGWGPSAKNAAVAANQAFIRYASSKIKKVKTLHKFVHLAVEANQKAHEEALLSHETTSHVGIVGLKQKNYWKVIISVIGDIKVFHYNLETKKCRELTKGSTVFVKDATDPGGKIGKAIENLSESLPDLRNYALYVYNVPSNTVFIPVSNGVFDNFDPMYLGLTISQTYLTLMRRGLLENSTVKPEHCTDELGWENSPHAKTLIRIFREMTLKDILDAESRNEKPDFTSAIVNYLDKITAPTRVWMENHPTDHQPEIGTELSDENSETETETGSRIIHHIEDDDKASESEESSTSSKIKNKTKERAMGLLDHFSIAVFGDIGETPQKKSNNRKEKEK